MGEYKLSRFAHIYSKDDRVCLYNALSLRAVYTDKYQYDSFNIDFKNNQIDIESDLIKQLIESGIILPKDYNEEIILDYVRKTVFTGVNIRVMVLHVSDFCNLKCKYCFIEGGQTEGYIREKMSLSTAIAAVDKFVKILQQHKSKTYRPSIVFYGGEPLTNWSVIKETLKYIDTVEHREDIKFDKVIITNGTLMTENIAEVIKSYGVLVSVSIDGIKHVNDANRIDYFNNGSYDRVVNSIHILKAAGVNPAVSCVMAKEGIDYYEQTIDFFANELEIKGLGFNHVSIIPGLTYYDSEYEESFADAILNVQELIQSKYPDVYERRMGHKVNMFIDKKLIKSDCTGCGEQISISPKGEIGICQGYMGTRKTFCHTVFENDYNPEQDDIFIEWSNRSPLNIEKCLSCPALATCGGGCPRNADMIHGSIWDVDSAFCHFAKKAQEWLIWQPLDE